jgi:hypothetical protein
MTKQSDLEVCEHGATRKTGCPAPACHGPESVAVRAARLASERARASGDAATIASAEAAYLAAIRADAMALMRE